METPAAAALLGLAASRHEAVRCHDLFPLTDDAPRIGPVVGETERVARARAGKRSGLRVSVREVVSGEQKQTMVGEECKSMKKNQSRGEGKELGVKPHLERETGTCLLEVVGRSGV